MNRAQKQRELLRKLRDLSKACRSGLVLPMMLRNLYPDEVDRSRGCVETVDVLWRLAEEAQEASGFSLPAIPPRDSSEGGYGVRVQELRRWAAQSWLQVRGEKKDAMPTVTEIPSPKTTDQIPATQEPSPQDTTEQQPLFSVREPCWVVCGGKKFEASGNTFDILKALIKQKEIPFKELIAALGGCSQGSLEQALRRLNHQLLRWKLPFHVRRIHGNVCVLPGVYKTKYGKTDN